jgi:hypothetical protein
MKLWAKVGMTIEVEEKLFKENPEQAVLKAFKEGTVMLDGETYFPNDNCDDMDFYGIYVTEKPH